jgi:uncharacterized protein YdaU (DUF1376 family)
MKDTYYFQHDYEPLSDPKLSALVGEFGALGYGLYWRIVEMLHSDTNHVLQHKKYIYTALAKQMLTSVEQVENLLNFAIDVCELFESDGNKFWSKRVQRNIEKRTEIIEKRSKAGKISAEKRKKATHDEHMLTHVQHNSTKESKGKEIKENIIDNNDCWIEKFKTDNSHTETIAMNVGISKTYLDNAKRDFITLIMFAEPKPNYREFLNHFTNWLKKNISNYKNPPR